MNSDSNPVDPSTDKRLFENNINRDWRAPTASEAELIEAWTRKTSRDDRPKFIGITGFANMFLVFTLVLPYIEQKSIGIGTYVFMLVLSVGIAVLTDCVVFLTLRNNKKIYSVDYQIFETVVISTSSSRGYRFSTKASLYLNVKTPSGEIINLGVNRLIYIVSYKNTPGFLVRFKGEKPIKKDSKMPIKIDLTEKRFFPAITWEEYVEKRGY
jgi:hypothetical protein